MLLEYTGADDEHSCPYFYLWDMQGLGKLSALTTIALVNGDITGALDETYTAGDLGDYTITEADDGGTEVVLGLPLEFNEENIEEMATFIWIDCNSLEVYISNTDEEYTGIKIPISDFILEEKGNLIPDDDQIECCAATLG